MLGLVRRLAGGALLGAALAASPAQSVPIDYTLTGTGTGTLNGVAFSNAPYVIRMAGNTDDVEFSGLGGYSSPVAASVSIQGHGTVAITEPALAVGRCNFDTVVGLGKPSMLPVPEFLLVAAFPGIVSNLCDIRVLNAATTGEGRVALNYSFATSGGTLDFESTSDITYSSAPSARRAAAPVPAMGAYAWSVLSVLLIVIAAFGRRRAAQGRG